MTASIEIVYWIFVKPFGFPKDPCSFETCTQHHYPSPTHKRIFGLGKNVCTSALVIFIGWRFYLVGHRYLNLPIPDEKRNQIPEGPSAIDDVLITFNFWEYFQND